MLSLKTQIKKSPPKPGIYIFQNAEGTFLYIGKSINIKERLRSHLTAKAGKGRTIVKNSKSIKTIVVASELEALLLEAKLIGKFKPRYNIVAKDDKHPLYIKITKEEFPKITTSRREEAGKGTYFGPFPSAGIVKDVLKQIRKIFPYCSQKRIGKKACFYSHIDLCNPCPAEILRINDKELRNKEKRRYRKNIKRILLLLRGKTKKLHKKLEVEMMKHAKAEDFEKAKEIREQLQKLDYITGSYIKTKLYLENPNLIEDIRQDEAQTLFTILKPYIKNLKPIKKIEAFDVAHTGGSAATCSLVVFVNGEPEKSLYRRFKIRSNKTRDDFAMLHEAVSRRLKNNWPEPDLLVIDGGKGQVSAAKRALEESGKKIPLIGLAKRHEEIVIPVKKDILGYQFKVLRKGLDNPAVKLLQRLRDEAHRFARSYHFKLRLKEIIGKT